MTVQSFATGDVRVEVNDHVVVVTIDRPSKRNALTQGMYATMSDTLVAADDDPDVGVKDRHDKVISLLETSVEGRLSVRDHRLDPAADLERPI